MPELTIRPLLATDYTALYEYWYDMQVLRQQLYRDTRPVMGRAEFLAMLASWLAQPHLVLAGAYDTLAGAVVVALPAEAATAGLLALIVDLHMPATQPVGKRLLTALVQALQSHALSGLSVYLPQPLPVEEAFWLASGAVRTEKDYLLTL